MRRAIGFAVGLTTLALCGAAAARFDPARVVAESAAVAARFPDPAINYDTPGFRAGREDFTSHAELLAFIDDLQKRSGGFALRSIGTSFEGRAIPLLALASGAAASPAAMLKSGKPTVMIVAQQHGNEPAGSEAALVIAARLAAGDLKPLLERINVVIVPRANPDGGEAFVRDTGARLDMNRDHLLLRTTEARAIALAARDYQPDVMIDAHEFTVLERWIAKYQGAMSYDALIQYATVGNLPAELAAASEQRFRTAIVAALGSAELVPHWYFTTAAGVDDKTVSMGGVQPDTWRNIGGLRNAISFLLETRGVGIGRAHFKRRVRTHELAMESLLRTAAGNAAEVLALTRGAGATVAAAACTGSYVVESEAARTTHALTFLDPVTGVPRDVEVPWRSALDVRALRTRPRPCGYFVAAAQRDAVGRLRALGVVVEALTAPATLAVERYRVVDIAQARREDGRGAIEDPEGVLRIKVETEPAQVTVPAGTFYIPLGQPLANLVAAALEPDSQSSYAANRLLPASGEGTVWRALTPPAVPRQVWDSP